MSIRIVCVVLYFGGAAAMSRIDHRSKDYHGVGAKCTFARNNTEGMCRELRNCPGAYRDERDQNIRPTVCSIDPDNNPIVCCGFKRRYEAYCNYHYGEPETAHLCYALPSGGTRTSPGEFPHMAALGWRSDNNTDYKCGGALIHEYFVLTAAHCTHKNGFKPNIVRIGDENLLTENPYFTFEIENIIKHPHYRAPKYYDDIALIKFGSHVDPFKISLKPACLPPEKLINYDDDVFNPAHWSATHALGYGATSFRGLTDDTHLNKVLIDHLPVQQCIRDFPPDLRLPGGFLSDTQICAGDKDEGIRDTCQGDSGGPLQRRYDLNVDGVSKSVKWYYVFGVTSFGRSCGTGQAGVYTRVTEYLDWIEGIIWPTETDSLFGANLTKHFGKCF